jgi:hypothetical protein
MPYRERKQATIVPQFASEDAEREWWASHDLATELWEDASPTEKVLPSLLPLEPRVADVPQVAFLLFVARKHKRLLRRYARSQKPSLAREHAAVALLCSAAAVDAGLNVYWGAFSQVPTANDVGSPRSRLELIWDYDSALTSQAALKAALERLFQRADAIAHRTGRLQDADRGLGLLLSDVDYAPQACDAAESFLNLLRLRRPPDRRR